MKFIPPWAVGFVGASLVIVSTILSSIVWSGRDDKAKELRQQSEEIGKNIDLMWSNHELADLREALAGQFIGMFVASITTTQNGGDFFLSEAGQRLRGAVLAMMVAADQTDEDDHLKTTVSGLEQQLRNRDLGAYSNLREVINDLRLQSIQAINELSEQKAALVAQIDDKESGRDRIRIWFVGLNLLGLAIVMLKDLPVWRTRDRHESPSKSSSCC